MGKERFMVWGLLLPPLAADQDKMTTKVTEGGSTCTKGFISTYRRIRLSPNKEISIPSYSRLR